jgi:hypothetical protein
MAFANNRKAARTKSSFRTAGGVTMLLRHPFLAGQISEASPVDQLDVSRHVKLNDQFLDAMPAQDSAFQEVMVDGSTVTITNHLMAGTLTLQAVTGSGFVGSGDLIAAAHLVIASKDDVGGTFTVIEYINGKQRITVFYGIAFKNVPHLRIAGNAVVVYPVTMLYSGWVQAIGSAAASKKAIWAVGNKYGISAIYKQFGLQAAESGDFYGGSPLTYTATAGIGGTSTADDTSVDADDNVNSSVVPDTNATLTATELASTTLSDVTVVAPATP